ncbi:hypothetical protein X975_22101, partial [Stegodyphus mimosarum]
MRKEMDDIEDEYADNTQLRKQVTAVPRNGYYDQSNDFQNWPVQQFSNQQQQYSNQKPCCNMPQQSQGGGMPAQQGGGMMTTQAPSGISITLGQGLPLSPLGILRRLLPNPKVDLKKKVFFGVQLENGFGFGGANGAGNAGGGNMGGQMGGGGNMGHQGGGGQQGGGMTYQFG